MLEVRSLKSSFLRQTREGDSTSTLSVNICFLVSSFITFYSRYLKSICDPSPHKHVLYQSTAVLISILIPFSDCNSSHHLLLIKTPVITLDLFSVKVLHITTESIYQGENTLVQAPYPYKHLSYKQEYHIPFPKHASRYLTYESDYPIGNISVFKAETKL